MNISCLVVDTPLFNTDERASSGLHKQIADDGWNDTKLQLIDFHYCDSGHAYFTISYVCFGQVSI